ncbi:MAG: hypothetical protein E6G61_03125, partial [Actinobacteria bacterium]
MTSGRQRNRNGAYLLVPRPGEMCAYAFPIRTNPDAIRLGTSELVTRAPTSGNRTCPPCVWPNTMR